jgi:hypothetical protein
MLESVIKRIPVHRDEHCQDNEQVTVLVSLLRARCGAGLGVGETGPKSGLFLIVVQRMLEVA